MHSYGCAAIMHQKHIKHRVKLRRLETLTMLCMLHISLNQNGFSAARETLAGGANEGYSPDFRCRTADRGRDADQDCSRPFPLRGLNQRAERKPRRSCSAELHSYDKRGNSDIYRLGRNIWELINSFHFSISLIKANM